jgi:tRNA A-37 threonylcarbamoyl transferase component Bud32
MYPLGEQTRTFSVKSVHCCAEKRVQKVMLQRGTEANGRQSERVSAHPEPVDAMEQTVELNPDPTAELAGPADAEPESTPPESTRPEVTPNGDIGRVLDERYVIEEKLSQGGSAMIMRARDLHDQGARNNGHIAIKTLRPELRFRPQSIARLQREFRQTRLLAHPNVVRHFGMGCDKGSWFIAMELLNGEALGRKLKASPKGLPAPEALRIAAACGDALAHAHDKGVTHGDVKPDNVFVTATKGVRVLDFGVAPDAATAPSASAPAEPVLPAATRVYASPEVLAGSKPEPRDDVFSLACVIYEMLTGRHPYGRVGADEARDAGITIERVPGLTSRQWQALAAGLAWTRDARPAHVRDLLRALSPEIPPAAKPSMVQSPRHATLSATWRLPVRAQARTAGFVALAGILAVLAIVESRYGPEPAALGETVISAGAAGAAAAVSQVSDAEVAGPGAAVTPPIAPANDAVRAPAAPPPRQVSFKTESMVVSRSMTAAAIPLQLEPGAKRVKAAWRAIDGSAVAGRDYGGPESGVANFQERQTDRILYVPILNDASAAGDRSFTVELTGNPSGARLGSPRRILVTIEGAG